MVANYQIAASDPCLQALHAAVEAAAPRTLLALGPDAGQPLDAYAAAHGECALTAMPTADWDGMGSFDLVFVAGVVEHLSKGEATTLLCRLRDRHARRLYVVLPMGREWASHASVWEQNDLIALGMERVGVCAEERLHLYRFDIHTYKPAPEWFNSKYWANPELWDKR